MGETTDGKKERHGKVHTFSSDLNREGFFEPLKL